MYCPLEHDEEQETQEPADDPLHPFKYCPLGHDEEQETQEPADDPPHPLKNIPLGHIAHVALHPDAVTDESECHSIWMIPVVDVTGEGMLDPEY